MIVWVLGMHRSGTSMAAHMLREMGIHMGDKLLEGQAGNPAGHFEDLDFLRMDKQILADAGGSWQQIPARGAIDIAVDKLAPEMTEIVDRKLDARRDWGWKDPRMAVLAPWWGNVVIGCGESDVRVVRTQRRRSEVVVSLIRRNGGLKRRWGKLCDQYERMLEAFLKQTRLPVYVIPYDVATHRKRSMSVALGLARFCGRGKAAAKRAIGVVKLR